jgi:hypothetical protein
MSVEVRGSRSAGSPPKVNRRLWPRATDFQLFLFTCKATGGVGLHKNPRINKEMTSEDANVVQRQAAFAPEDHRAQRTVASQQARILLVYV